MALMAATSFAAFCTRRQTMSKREAALVLGVSPTAQPKKIRESHKRIMLLNHPDKGGSPYLAAKINEAKDLLDK